MAEKLNLISTNEEAQAAFERGKKLLFGGDSISDDLDLDADVDKTNAARDKALEEFTEAIRLDPNFVNAYLLRVYIYSLRGQNDQGADDLSEIIRIDPNNALSYMSRGDFYCINNQFDKAIDDYTMSIKLAPDYANGYKSRGEAYKQLGQMNQAIQDFEKALSLNPDDESIKKLLQEVRGY